MAESLSVHRTHTTFQEYSYQDDNKIIIKPEIGSVLCQINKKNGESDNLVVVTIKTKKNGYNKGIIDEAIFYPIVTCDDANIIYEKTTIAYNLKLTNHGSWFSVKSCKDYDFYWDILSSELSPSILHKYGLVNIRTMTQTPPMDIPLPIGDNYSNTIGSPLSGSQSSFPSSNHSPFTVTGFPTSLSPTDIDLTMTTRRRRRTASTASTFSSMSLSPPIMSPPTVPIQLPPPSTVPIQLPPTHKDISFLGTTPPVLNTPQVTPQGTPHGTSQMSAIPPSLSQFVTNMTADHEVP